MATELRRSSSLPGNMNRLDVPGAGRTRQALLNVAHASTAAKLAELALKNLEAEKRADTAETRVAELETELHDTKVRHGEILTPEQIRRKNQPYLITRLVKGSVKLALLGATVYGAHTLASKYSPEQYEMLQKTLIGYLDTIGVDQNQRTMIANTADHTLQSIVNTTTPYFRSAKSTVNVLNHAAKDLVKCHEFVRIEGCKA